MCYWTVSIIFVAFPLLLQDKLTRSTTLKNEFLYTQRRPGSVFRPTESTCILPTKKMASCLTLPEPMDFLFTIEPNPVIATTYRTLHVRLNQLQNRCGMKSKEHSRLELYQIRWTEKQLVSKKKPFEQWVYRKRTERQQQRITCIAFGYACYSVEILFLL